MLVAVDGATWATVSWIAARPFTSAVVAASLAGAVAVLAVGVNRIAGTYSRRWQLAEWRQIRTAGLAAIPATLAVVIALAVIGRPSWAFVGAGVGSLAFVLTGGARGLWRALNEHQHDLSGAAHPAIVMGAGHGGRHILEALRADPVASPVRAVALLDDDPALHGREIEGLVVRGGRECLGDVAADTGATELLVAIPSADSELVRDLERLGRDLGLTTSVLPSVAELVGRAIRPSDIRDITPTDLLGRNPVDLDLPRRSGYLEGATVLVTGAGGSIGSELCRQIHRLGTSTLLMLDRDESALHALQLSLDGQAQLRTNQLIVADIRDADRVAEIFDSWRPHVVFHAAALKHLPLLEMHPHEGVKTNVLGTQNLLAAAAAHGVARFVNVSTDKAADPTSVLGWTKLLAERLTTHTGLITQRPYLSVRFGNVLGSRGSVLTAFTSQIAEGGPVTVTHPDVTRYFMTVEEAASLVIAAGSGGDTGDVMILEMGEPVRILDMANELIDRSGADVDIVFTGLRPGEKIHEVLQSTSEAIVKTDDGLMWKGASHPMPWEDVEPLLEIEDAAALVERLSCLATPVREHERDILLQPPVVGAAERAAVLAAIDSGWIAPAGPDLMAFEDELAQRIGAERVLAVASGSAALHLGLLVLGVGPGDEVVVQTTTFAASAFAVCHTGATPMFCDVDRATGMLDPDALAVLLAERARRGRLPKAVMPVDLYGACADYVRLRAVCDPYGIPILQDSAEALGAVSQGRPAGRHGDLAVFSFNGNKIVTTSSGGALVGPPRLLERASKLATQAREPALHYEHAEIGHNYRLSNLLAALGRAQLRDLDARIDRKLRVRCRYRELIPEAAWFPDGVTERSNAWLNVALLPDDTDRDRVIEQVQAKGIEVRPAWKPMHLQPVFDGVGCLGGSVAEALFDRGVCLPSGSDLTIADQERVADAVSLAIESSIRVEVGTW